MYRWAYGNLLRHWSQTLSLRGHRRRGQRTHEGGVDRLNVPPPSEAQLGGEAVISEAAVRKYYLDLFPLPAAILESGETPAEVAIGA
jgi:hypothetical protein